MELARELSRFLGLVYDPNQWNFEYQQDEIRAAEQFIHFRKPVKEQILIGVDSATGLSDSRLVQSHLAHIVSHLAGTLRAKVMLFSLDGPGELESSFAAKLGGNVLDTPELGLRETLALLSQCSLFVAGNTELFHASVVFGVPTLGLFTDADKLDWEPRERDCVAVLRGKPGEKISLSDLESSVKRILHAQTA
jgi:ADP-heptose:LPS heptosyltransferase